MRRLALTLAALLLLAGCAKKAPAPIWTPSPVSTTPATPSVHQPDAWWDSLTTDALPTALATVEDLEALGDEEVLLLGRTAATALYGLGGESGILLLRDGELAHFEQVLSSQNAPALPSLYQFDYDGDGLDELAVRYLVEAEEDIIIYDVHFYDWSDDLCTDTPATRDVCAEQALEEIDVSYASSTGILTLSYGDTNATYQFPEQYRQSNGQMRLATSFFREENGVFTIVLGARAETTGAWFANVLADIEFDGESITLRNIRVEPTTVV